MNFSWQCPFCNQHATITKADKHFVQGAMPIESAEGPKYISNRFYVCPNEKCKKFTLDIFLFKAKPNAYGFEAGTLEKEWQLIPNSKAKQFKLEYKIPKAIIADYEEACLIRSLSPKASATLSRRCLQGMIRDFWGVKKPDGYEGFWSLAKEIKVIKDKVEPEVWGAIEVVRKVGNIGAHMESDVNVIVNVTPDEADKLIGLIELLIEEWYVNKFLRAKRLSEITAIGEEKKSKKA